MKKRKLDFSAYLAPEAILKDHPELKAITDNPIFQLWVYQKEGIQFSTGNASTVLPISLRKLSRSELRTLFATDNIQRLQELHLTALNAEDSFDGYISTQVSQDFYTGLNAITFINTALLFTIVFFISPIYAIVFAILFWYVMKIFTMNYFYKIVEKNARYCENLYGRITGTTGNKIGFENTHFMAILYIFLLFSFITFTIIMVGFMLDALHSGSFLFYGAFFTLNIIVIQILLIFHNKTLKKQYSRYRKIGGKYYKKILTEVVTRGQ